MQGILDRIASALLDVVYPASCPACEGKADSLLTAPICSSCWREIAPYRGPACTRCGEPFVSADALSCGRCLADPPPFKRAASFGLHRGALKEAVHLLKFSSVRRLARPLGRMLAWMDLPPADIVVPVPLGPAGLRERGFNQTLLLALALSRESGTPVDAPALRKKKDTPSQVGLSRSRRLKNLAGAFEADPRRVEGKDVLVLDDVITTGATVRECSKALLRAGASTVWAVSVARSASEDVKPETPVSFDDELEVL